MSFLGHIFAALFCADCEHDCLILTHVTDGSWEFRGPLITPASPLNEFVKSLEKFAIA
jgi:hypothetical protein